MSEEEKEDLHKLRNDVEREMREQEEWLRKFEKSIKLFRRMAIFYLIALLITFSLLVLSFFFTELTAVSSLVTTLLNIITIVWLIYLHERNKSTLSIYPLKFRFIVWGAIILNMCLAASYFWESV